MVEETMKKLFIVLVALSVALTACGSKPLVVPVQGDVQDILVTIEYDSGQERWNVVADTTAIFVPVRTGSTKGKWSRDQGNASSKSVFSPQSVTKAQWGIGPDGEVLLVLTSVGQNFAISAEVVNWIGGPEKPATK